MSLLFLAYKGFESLVNLAEEILENEYRQVVRDLFEDVGLPTEVVDDLTFEYADSIW